MINKKEIVVPPRQYPIPEDWKPYYPTPEAVYKRLVAEHGTDFDDPEDVTDIIQNMYDFSYSDADEVAFYVFENFL